VTQITSRRPMNSAGEYLDDLCEVARYAARSRGHDLADWQTPSGDEAIARAAACLRCGRIAYIRAEGGFLGAAGEALVEACDTS
jgi:hypothetical protein